MHKALPIILLFLIVAFSGCTGSDSQDELVQTEFELANPNLNGKIVDVKLVPVDIRAGEKVTAELIIANTGTENITKETVDIKAKVKTLNDTMANLALKFTDDEKKIRTFTMDFDDEIKPGTVKSISAIFNTQQEMQGRSLAGTYQITITLSVNGQKVDAKLLPVTLHSGTPRVFTPTPPPTPTSTSSPTIPAIIATETPTPTPTPTPEPVVTATPTGVRKEVRIVSPDKFGINQIQINAGDEIFWLNREEETYTLIELDRKIGNITLASNANYTFTTTGNYHFALTRPNLRTAPSVLNVTVRINTSQ